MSSPNNHPENIRPLLLMDAPRPGYWHRLHSSIVQFRPAGEIILVAAALSAAIYCLLLWLAPPEPVPQPFSFPEDAHWITTPVANQQSTGCFRLDLSVPGKVVNAWISLATDGGFEVLANGRSCSAFYFWRRTTPFQTSLSQEGQKLNPVGASLAINYPREYQWKDHDNAELPIWVDLTSYLHPGHNALCVEVEDNANTPALILSGEIQLETGEKILIRSGAQWKAEPVPKDLPQYKWVSPLAPVTDWAGAREIPWQRSFWRLVPKGVFEEPFRGARVRSVTPGVVTWISQDFDLPERPLEGFFRVVTDTPFQVWVNDSPIRPLTSQASILGFGPWFFRELSRSPMDIALDHPPENLAPNQTATLLPGQQRENPSGRDISGNHRLPDQFSPGGTVNNPETNGNLLAVPDTLKGDPYANLQDPDRIVPPALTTNRRIPEYLAYSITPFLRKGVNTVRIGLYKDKPAAADLSHQPFIAFDGGAQLVGGQFSSFSSGGTTRGISGVDGSDSTRLTNVDLDGPIEPILLPIKQFSGYAYPNQPWFSICAAIFILLSVTLLLGVSKSQRLARALKEYRTACAVFVGWTIAGFLLRSSMMERSEYLYWRLQAAPILLLAVALAGSALVFVLQHRRQRRRQDDIFSRRRTDLSPAGPNWGWIWRFLVGLGIALCFVLRAWQIDLQPPDEDEYASIQAALAIAQKGVPEYQEGVWYTRSPAYHYLAGGIAALTGGDMYTLRLLTVIFACATAFLVWKIASELTHSRFLALGALILFDIHPFLIFTGHVARFYQQQQFFHLLAVYFFYRGFIANSGMRDRYLTVAAFLAAALSQEITVLEIIPLTICYFLFAQRRSWPDEIRLLVAAGCALALIALDLAFFKIQCLTALDGISPRIDATVGWEFAEPANFVALLIGYSRLHLIPSVFLLVGFVFSRRTKNTGWIFLYLYLFTSMVVINVLITSRGYRFEYHLIPIWILLAVYGLGECAKFFIQTPEQSSQRLALAIGWLAIVICSWSPWRILESYDSTLQADPVRALRYVSNNLRSGDRVAITELYPQAALLETGRTDYDIAIPILYDFALRKKGKLVDRNGAAEVVGNLDELQRAFARNQRLWIVLDRDLMHARGSGVRWEFPGGRTLLYLQTNAHLMFRSPLWSVYLWDQNAGEYSSFRENPGNWFD
jgi:hypothetical protein